MNKIWMLGLSLAIALFSCTDPDLIGLEIQPQSDRITISSLTESNVFSLTSTLEDSIKIDENNFNLLGAYEDPLFGLSEAYFSAQLIPSDNEIDFGVNAILDSAVMSFAYAGFYGDTTQELSIDVVELSESIYLDSSYYSGQSFSVGTPLSSFSFYPRPLTKRFFDEDSIGTPQLRVVMNELGTNLLEIQSEMTDNESFLSAFKGIQLKANTVGNSITYFNLKDNMSKLALYYHNDEHDSLRFDLYMGATAARLNHFDLERSLAEDVIGIQSMGGYNVRVSFNNLEYIDSLLSGKVVNKAVLTFNIEDGSEEEFAAHQNLSLVRVDSTGKKYFLSDFFEGAEHFGGVKDLIKGQYVFNVSKHLQEMILGSIEEKDIYLVPIGGAVNANRTILTEEVGLDIIYTEF